MSSDVTGVCVMVPEYHYHVVRFAYLGLYFVATYGIVCFRFWCTFFDFSLLKGFLSYFLLDAKNTSYL